MPLRLPDISQIFTANRFIQAGQKVHRF